MRRLLLVVLVLGVVLVGVDRVAVGLAERAVAEQAQQGGALAERPEVDVLGFPFLTQAVRGRYEQVRLRTSGDVGGVEVERLDVRLRGVQVPLADVVAGRVAAVPVDGVRGEVVVTYVWLSEQAGENLTVSGEGDLLRLRGEVRLGGRRLSASALSQISLVEGALVLRAQEFDTGAGGVDRLLRRVLADRFDVRVPVEGLPYGLELTGVAVRPEGVLLTSVGGPTVLAP